MTRRGTTAVGLDLVEAMRFHATGQDGVGVELDSDGSHGGSGHGLRPMELLLVGLGGCTAMDVLSILRKKRQDITGYRVEVMGSTASEIPHVFTEIAIRHIVRGNAVREEAVRRAIELSETKYCPAFAMLGKAATITSTYEIHASVPAD